jgi:hypothetical protein
MAGKTSGKMTWREIQTKLGSGCAKCTEKKKSEIDKSSRKTGKARRSLQHSTSLDRSSKDVLYTHTTDSEC